MESTCRNRTLQWISKQLKKGNISLTHKLQRKEGQWNRQTRSELIDSLLRGYPINPTYAVKENDILSLIDGVQRISTIRDYLSDAFALSKNLEPIIVKENTEEGIVEKEIVIAGKKFSKLDDDVQDLLLASELQIYEMANYTEKDVREMFRRQNSGKALNSTQLRTSIESEEMRSVICSLTSHPFFEKALTKTQKKRDLDKDVIRETFMLTETDAEHDYTSFKSKNINDFVLIYQENINYEKIDIIRQALDHLNESFEVLKVNIVSLPMILYSAYKTVSDGKEFDKFVALILNFVNTYDSNEEYKQFCQSGTTSSDKVRGRFDYWRRLIQEI